MTDAKLTELVDLDQIEVPIEVPADPPRRRRAPAPRAPARAETPRPRLPPYDIAWSDKP